MKSTAHLILTHANELLTLSGHSDMPKTGSQMDELGLIKDGAVAVSEGTIIACGLTEDVLSQVPTTSETIQIDTAGKVVMPGFVDCHTHLVFGGSREEEFEQRIRGASYLDILKAGGGILHTVRATRAAGKEELIVKAVGHLETMLKFGTTTIEAKSGYGLTIDDELKQLTVIHSLKDRHPIDTVSTFLVHTTPPEFGSSREYVDFVINTMLPRMTEMAEYCDIFCEQGVFDNEESRQVLTAAKNLGFRLKIHADQLTDMGGAGLAADLNATSASHLDHISRKGIEMMAGSGTIAVLLPGASFFLRSDTYPPARDMISSGVPVALATDFNPGSCPTESMQMILTLACLQLYMSPAQAICAATINAAHALDRADTIGSLEVGKQADIIILDVANYKSIPYHFGVNNVKTVIKKGRIVYTD